MTAVAVFSGVWLLLAAVVAVGLGRALRHAAPTPPPPVLWLVPDDVAGLHAELPQRGAR